MRLTRFLGSPVHRLSLVALIVLSVCFVGAGWALAGGFVPPSGSPLAQQQHPRLHLTQGNLPEMRAKIAAYYRDEYQRFVNWVDANFTQNEVSNTGLMADHHALIHILGPIAGITYPRNISDYGTRAIDILMSTVNAGLPTTYVGGYNYHDSHQTMARTYDWMWHDLSPAQRVQIVAWLAAAGAHDLNRALYERGKDLFSSRYFEAVLPWYIGLAFYGDRIQDTDAQNLLDSFNTLMLNGGWLDAQNWAGRHQGGVSEIGEYGLWHPIRHILQLDGWRSATDIDYLAQGTDVAGPHFIAYPQYIAYRIKPFGRPDPASPGGVEWKLTKMGQLDAAPSISIPNRILTSLGAPLKTGAPEMAALNRWLLEQRGTDDLRYEWHFLLNFLLGDRSVAAQSPAQLGLPNSRFFEGIGLAVLRTGFESLDDTVISVMAPHYRLSGHSWFGVPLGFLIDKYGPLALYIQAYKRGKGQRQNIMHFSDPLLPPDGGSDPPSMCAQDSVLKIVPGGNCDMGGMMRLVLQADHDYLAMDSSKVYNKQRVNRYSRHMVYLRPQQRTNSDYVVIFDRVETTRPDIIKKWQINSAYRPEVNGSETLIREGQWEYQRADQIIISNNVNPDPYNGVSYSGHGRLFVKTLLPQAAKIVTTGGPGHEFENDLGVNEGTSTDYNQLAQVGAFYVGTYHTEVVSLNLGTQDNFLHVLQTADANTTHQMADTRKVETQSGNMTGAFISASTGQPHAVVLFAKAERVLGDQESITYEVTGQGEARHLIVDLPANQVYEIYDNGQLVATRSTTDVRSQHARDLGVSPSGMLFFNTSLTSKHLITLTPTGGNPVTADKTPPFAPLRFRLQ